MTTLADLRAKVIATVRDDSQKLVNPDDYDRAINAALRKYSLHRPDYATTDIAGNGTHDLALPTGWVDGYSMISSAEYPIGQVPSELLANDEVDIYRSPTALKIRLRDVAPAAAESVRLTFTIQRSAATVPDNDIDAVAWLSAALCCEDLANAFAQSTDSSIAADSVDYRDKSQKFASRAKRLMQLYKEHLGLKDNDTVTPASVVSDIDVGYPGGGGRLTHPRWMRERR